MRRFRRDFASVSSLVGSESHRTLCSLCKSLACFISGRLMIDEIAELNPTFAQSSTGCSLKDQPHVAVRSNVDGKLCGRGRSFPGCNRLKKRCGCTQPLVNAPEESPMFKCVTGERSRTRGILARRLSVAVL